MPGTLDTGGALIDGTHAELEAWDTIRHSLDQPLEDVAVQVTDAGVLDLSEELSAGDPDNDGVPEARGATVYASGEGNTITTGSGNDTLRGSEGDDELHGGAGDDVIFDGGLSGANLLDGGTGDDTLLGSEGSDTLLGGEGNDRLSDFGGTNLLDGGHGDDTLEGGEGDDPLLGGDGNNNLSDSEGTNVLDGGAGDDVFEVNAGYVGPMLLNTTAMLAGTNMIEGGTGNDTLITYGLDGITVSNVEVLKVAGGYIEAMAEQLSGFFRIESADDPLGPLTINLVGAGTLDLSGKLGGSVRARSAGRGNIIVAGSGDDTLDGAEGDDTLRGGAGDDVIAGWGGTNTLDGGAGDDWLGGGDGDDTLLGGDGNDHLTDHDHSYDTTNLLDGGAGDDRIEAHGSLATIIGGAGRDDIEVGDATGSISGGDEDDAIDASGFFGTIDGGEGDDTIEIDGVRGSIDGGTGHDRLLVSGWQSLAELAIFNVEVLAVTNGSVEATAAQLDAFDSIVVDGDPTGMVEIDLVGRGTADLSEELDVRSAVIRTSAAGNTIIAGSGNDILYGDTGDDTLRAGDGDDEIWDRADGVEGGGTNILDGGAGNDRIYVARGARGTIDGGAGYDALHAIGDISGLLAVGGVEELAVGGPIQATTGQLDGFDHIVDDGTYDVYPSVLQIQVAGVGSADLSDELGPQAVRITASAFGNGLVTGSGDDILLGGAGRDWLAAGEGDDALKGGLGDDTLLGGDGADYLNGGRGTNTVAYTGGEGVVLALDGSLTATNDAVGDVFHGISNLFGSSAGDRLRGNDSANLLDGGAGNDRLEGRDDNDRLHGGEGNDTLIGGEDNDVLFGGAGQDTLNGGAGYDDFVFASASESGPSAAARDIVTGFTKGQDDLLVGAIDAKANVAGDQAFVLDTNRSFSTGEIRQTVVSGGLLIEFNTDVDAAAEMSVLLASIRSTLSAGDFAL